MASEALSLSNHNVADDMTGFDNGILVVSYFCVLPHPKIGNMVTRTHETS